MDIVTFDVLDDDLIDSKYNVCYYQSGCSENSADILILDINTIFDYEESKHQFAKKQFASLAIIDDESDYDAFKNFGIDAWIKRDEISSIKEFIEIVQKRFLS